MTDYLVFINAGADHPFAWKTIMTWLIILLVLILLCTHQSITVDIADKKGYSKLKAGFIGLIPIFGIIWYYRAPKKRNITKRSIINCFNPRRWLPKMIIYMEIIILCVIIIIPVIYIFGTALSGNQSDIYPDIWPTKPNLNGFKRLIDGNFFIWYKNTLIIAIIDTIVGTILITGASYVFARFNFKGKKAGLLSLLVLQAFPTFMGLVAMYTLFNKFGLLGKPTALTILYIGGAIPGNLWLIKGFLQNIPKDLDESAMIDGANKLQIFFKIILPLSVPILGFVAVNMFMGPWMDYMLPSYLLDVTTGKITDSSKNWTLAVGLFKFINDAQRLDYAAFAAGAIIIGLPITVLYVIFQRFLIEGIMSGATKG